MVNENEASVQAKNNENIAEETAALKRKTLVGPWKYISDFKQVYDWLFSETSNDSTRQQANKEMRIWMNRRGNLCPAGVTATRTILDVLLKDAASTYAVADMQTFYAFALIRFVNYMVSTEHTHNLRSMYDIARDIGLWTLVIDVRHVCAHDLVLPDLKLFREVTNYCLSWIKDYYWHPLYVNMHELSTNEVRIRDETKEERNVNQLFDVYNAAFEGCLRGATNLKNSKRYLHKRPKSFQNLKTYCKLKNLSDLETVLHNVVTDLNSLAASEIYMDNFEDIYNEAFFNMHYLLNFRAFYQPAEHMETIISLTQSLFRFLANFGLIRKIFEHLILIAESQFYKEVQRASAGFWVEQIAKGFLAFKKCQIMHDGEIDQNRAMKSSDLTEINAGIITDLVKKIFLYSGIDMETTLIFGSSKVYQRAFTFTYDFINERLKNVCEHTAPALQSLLNILDPSLDKTTYKELKSLVDVLCGVTINSKTKASTQNDDINEAKTVEDLFKMAQSNSNEIETKQQAKARTAQNNSNENVTKLQIDNEEQANADVNGIAAEVAMAEKGTDVDAVANAAKVTVAPTAANIAADTNNIILQPIAKRKKVNFEACEFDWTNCALGRLPWE